MALQRINPVLPFGKPFDERKLATGINVGDSFDEGDIADGVSIVDGVTYVVSGSPSSGTITYNGAARAFGSKFDGVAGNTTFTRSTSTVRLVRVQGDAVLASERLEDAFYIVAGASSSDTIVYPSVDGDTYGRGASFRGAAGGRFTINGSAEVFKIESINRVETLAMYQLGARPVPNIIDNSQALGIEDTDGAAIPADGVYKIYLWNYGTTRARVWFRSFISDLERKTGATSRDINEDIDPNEMFAWIPTDLFWQQGTGRQFGTQNVDRELALGSFIIQSESSGVWIKPEFDSSVGLQ